MTGESGQAAAAWDAEYAAGRYAGEPPVALVGDILAAAREAGLTRGLYIGCGNGRNYLPLVAEGLDLTGLDVSAAAIAQLSARAPDRRDRLVHGDLSVLPAATTYPLVIGIQVFQHGDRAAAHAHIRAAQRRLAPGGVFCLRVNATATDVWPGHEVTERHPDGGSPSATSPGPSTACSSTSSPTPSWARCSPTGTRPSCRHGRNGPRVSRPSPDSGLSRRQSGAKPGSRAVSYRG
jgi:SAM-dependent methyltransferase